MEPELDIPYPPVKKSNRNHYLGMVAFSFTCYMVLDIAFLGESFGSRAIVQSLGGSVAALMFGYACTIWKGPKLGWFIVLLMIFVSFKNEIGFA